MDEEQAVFEELILSDFKKWSSTVLQAHSQVWEIFDNWKPFKNDGKCFLFHLKSSSCSQDI